MIDSLAEALRFYADPKQYEVDGPLVGGAWGSPHYPIDDDRGQRARDALAALPPEVNRWLAFTDEEVKALLIEMTMDDGIVYGFEKDDEPCYSLWRQLTAEIERRGLLPVAD